MPLLARACSHCETTNAARGGAIAVAAGLVVLMFAVVGAIYVATHPLLPVDRQAAPRQTVAQPGVPVAGPAAAERDFGWLKAAMTACDEAASRQPAMVYFLVIPLVAEPRDLADWRLLAVGAIGNAITIPGNDALGGLRSGKLRIATDDYLFAIQDGITRTIYKLGAAAGTKEFSSPELAKVRNLRMQLQPRRKTDDTDWGDVYPRQNSTCHWVAAILRD